MSEILNGLIQAIDEQLQSPQTPYVRMTLERLLALGLNEQQAREEMADCLGEELDDMLAKSRPFEEKSYRALGRSAREQQSVSKSLSKPRPYEASAVSHTFLRNASMAARTSASFLLLPRPCAKIRSCHNTWA